MIGNGLNNLLLKVDVPGVKDGISVISCLAMCCSGGVVVGVVRRGGGGSVGGCCGWCGNSGEVLRRVMVRLAVGLL